jgi:hypothetical protein
MKVFFFFFFMLLIHTSCVKQLDYQVPFEGARLVVIGVLSPKEIVSLQLSKTFPVTGKQLYVDQLVGNAHVQLFENGNAIESLQHDTNGKYISISGFKPKAGNAYYVAISAESLLPVTSLPEVIPFPSAPAKYDLGDTITSVFASGRITRKLSLTLSDSSSVESFYILTLKAYYKGKKVAINSFSLDRPNNIDDLCGFSGEDNTYFLRDICFDRQAITVNLGMETSGFLQETVDDLRPGSMVSCDSITLQVSNANKAYFDFLRQEGYQDTGFLQAFSPIGTQYTNVQGGYGILAGINRQNINIYP